MNKKLIQKLHLWLGLASGIVVFILGITGCLYVFEEELRPIVYANHYIINETDKKPLPLSDLLKIAQDTLGTKDPISAIAIHNSKNRSYRFKSFADNPVEQKIWYWEGIENRKDLFINQYTGEVIKIKNSEFEFFRVVMWFHWSLLFSTDIGQPIVGIATIIFVISLITGLILWWPKNKNAIKQRFWFRWKNTTKWKRKNYDLHNILGYYMMLPALIIALTGLVWAFKWYDNGIQWALNGGKTTEKNEKLVSDSTQVNSKNNFDKIYSSIQYLHPKASDYNFFIPKPKDSSATFKTFIKYENRLNDISIEFDQHTGKTLQTTDFNDKNTGEKFRSINYDLHVGRILGLPGKILAFIASFVCAGLPITGFLIWWGRNNKKKKTVVS